jgi:hypothetical protein
MQICGVICEPKERVMKEVRVRPGYTTNPHHVANFLQAIQEAQKLSSRAYTTDITAGAKPYIVTTGSKEIHLRLGEIGNDARQALMELIDAETAVDKQLVVTYYQINEQKRSILCGVDRLANGLTHVLMSPMN